MGPQLGEGAVWAFGDGGAEFGLVAAVEGEAVASGGAGRGLAGSGTPLLEPADPRFADGESSGDDPGGAAGIGGGQDEVAKVLGLGPHRESSRNSPRLSDEAGLTLE